MPARERRAVLATLAVARARRRLDRTQCSLVQRLHPRPFSIPPPRAVRTDTTRDSRFAFHLAPPRLRLFSCEPLAMLAQAFGPAAQDAGHGARECFHRFRATRPRYNAVPAHGAGSSPRLTCSFPFSSSLLSSLSLTARKTFRHRSCEYSQQLRNSGMNGS